MKLQTFNLHVQIYKMSLTCAGLFTGRSMICWYSGSSAKAELRWSDASCPGPVRCFSKLFVRLFGTSERKQSQSDSSKDYLYYDSMYPNPFLCNWALEDSETDSHYYGLFRSLENTFGSFYITNDNLTNNEPEEKNSTGPNGSKQEVNQYVNLSLSCREKSVFARDPLTAWSNSLCLQKRSANKFKL